MSTKLPPPTKSTRKKKPRRGQPPKPATDRKSGKIELRINGPRRAAYDAYVSKLGLPTHGGKPNLSAWLREIADNAAGYSEE